MYLKCLNIQIFRFYMFRFTFTPKIYLFCINFQAKIVIVKKSHERRTYRYITQNKKMV